MQQEKAEKIIVIAIIAGTLAGLVGSPGFAVIVPLMFMMGVTENFNVALGIFFMGIVLPDLISSIMYYYKNATKFDLEQPLLFTVVFTVMSAISIYFSEYFHTNHKFFLAGTLQLFIGMWYILYGYHKFS